MRGLGTALDETVGDLVQAIAHGEIGTGLEIISRALDGGTDPRQFARQVVEWLRMLLLITASDKIDLESERMVAQAELMKTDGILVAMHAFSKATRGERTAWQPGLALELAFMDAVQESPASEKRQPEIQPEPDATTRNKSGGRSEESEAVAEDGSASEQADVPTQSEPEPEVETDLPEPEAQPVAEKGEPQFAKDSSRVANKSQQAGIEFQQVLDA